MFFWRRVAPQIPEEGLKPTATPGYTRNFRDLNNQVSRGKSFSGYERNALFLNRNGNGFVEVGGLLGVDFDDDARAVASVDWDRDGDLDLWVTNRTGPRVRLLRNNQPSADSFLTVHLIGNGRTTNRDAIGARLTLWNPSRPESQQIRTVRAGDGFLSQSSAWVHFGLGEATEDLNLSVAWPGSGTETFAGLKPGGRYTITQGQDLEVPTFASSSAATKSDQNFSDPKVSEPSPSPGRSGFWVANRVPLPDLGFTDPRGTAGSTTDFLGQPVLVNFWATWCVPCVEELSMFALQAGTLRDRGTTVLALNVDGLAVDGSAAPAASAEEVLARVGYDLHHGFAREETLAKIEILIEYLSSRRTPLSIPSSFLVDAQGKVAAVYLEAVSWEQLAGDLALLDAPQAEQLARASPRTGRWFADPRRSVDRAAYLGDFATLFATNGFADESQRLYQMSRPQGGSRSAQEYYNQAKAAAQQGRRSQAMEYYRAAIELEPEYGPALSGLGALLLMEKRVEEAQRYFEQALLVDPNHATALINLAMIDQSRGDKETALKRLGQVIARNPEYAEAHLNRGSLLASMKRYDEAIQHLMKAVELQPKMEAARINLATAYMQTQQWDKAEDQYRHLQQLGPRMAAYSHFGLGNALAAQQRYGEAVAFYRKAIDLGAKNAQTLTQLGRCLAALGEQQSAVDALKRALQLDPNYEPAKAALREIGDAQ